MIRKASYFAVAVALVLGATAAAGQGSPGDVLAPAPGADTLRELVDTRRLLERLGPKLGPDIWPGFRPDTIPALLFIPNRGFLLAGWRGALPAGFVEADAGGVSVGWRGVDAKGVASTGTELEGRRLAQAVVNPGMGRVPLVGLMTHEAFHVYAWSAGGLGAARNENAMLLVRYPVFDAGNEAGAVLEGRALAAALRAPDEAGARRELDRFLAVRRERQRRLPAEMVEYEEGAELNEGRAEYALVRSQEAAGGPRARQRVAQRLDSLAQPERSVRTRFYVTGAGQALLLDRLMGAAWKDSLAAWGAYGGARIEQEARARTADLQARRTLLADSILARPGVLLTLAGDSLGGLGLCGFDPQNLLAGGGQTYLHTRWLRVCATGFQAELNVPTVERRDRYELKAVVGPADSVRVTAAGVPLDLPDGRFVTAADVRLEAPGASLSARRAVVERRGRELRLIPLRP